MVRRLIALFMCPFFLCITSSSFAQLQIQLTQGVDAAIPIVIMPFQDETLALDNQTELLRVIQSDLKNSGQFRLIAPSTTNASTLTTEQLAALKKRGANVVLSGSIRSASAGKLKVAIQLSDLYRKGQSSDTATKFPVILKQEYTVKTQDLRLLAHHISDMVYQQLTGVKGIFSTKIAYVLVKHTPRKPTQYQLMLADADGYNPRPLLTSYMPIMSPAWVQDGRHLVYVSFEGHRASVYWQDIATGKRRLLSRSPGINGAPAVSPDGKRLAIVLTKTGNPKVYVMDIASGSLQQITQGVSIDTEPSWSPDGKTLLLTSNRGGTPQIYQYNFSTKRIKRLTFDGNYNAKASFMPNQKTIVMMHRDRSLFGIARQDLVSGRLDVLTRSGSDESPSLSPNGKMVIYAMRQGQQGVLAVVSTDGMVKLRLPAQAGSVQEPAWSPFLS